MLDARDCNFGIFRAKRLCRTSDGRPFYLSDAHMRRTTPKSTELTAQSTQWSAAVKSQQTKSFLTLERADSVVGRSDFQH